MFNLRSWLNALGFGEVRCCHCDSPYFKTSAGQKYLCKDCQIELAPYIGPRCPLCGLPYDSIDQDYQQAASDRPLRKECPSCRKTPPAWSNIAYHGLYEGALRDLLLRFKFDGELILGRTLAEFMLQAASCLNAPDALVPIPQHPAHLRKRGYNQAHELARTIARIGNLPLKSHFLKRVSQQRIQEGLTAEQRRQNLANAFTASDAVGNLHIWLIDDVMTTGSTCQAASNALISKGVNRISVLVCARTSL